MIPIERGASCCEEREQADAGRGLQPLPYLGLLFGLLCMLAGCGSNGGSSTTGNTASRSRQLALQLQLSSEAASTAPPAGLPAAQARQVQPGDPGFIARLEIRLQVQGSDVVSPQVFLLDPAQQETATLDVAVPDTVPSTFEVLVSAFTSQGIEAYRGQTTVTRGQTSAGGSAAPPRACTRARYCRQFAANDL